MVIPSVLLDVTSADLLAARSQMAFTLGFHIVLACLGVGLPALVLVANWLGLRGNPDALLLARRWSTVMAVTFASGILGLAALVLLRRGAPLGTRPLAVGAVVAVVWGWGVSQYPDILPGTLSLTAAAAPPGSLEALLVIFVVAAVVIAPSLLLLFVLAQRSRLAAHDLSAEEVAVKPPKRGQGW